MPFMAEIQKNKTAHYSYFIHNHTLYVLYDYAKFNFGESLDYIIKDSTVAQLEVFVSHQRAGDKPPKIPNLKSIIADHHIKNTVYMILGTF
jgi:hypothetical protein